MGHTMCLCQDLNSHTSQHPAKYPLPSKLLGCTDTSVFARVSSWLVTSKIIHYSQSHVTTFKVIRYFRGDLITSKVNKYLLLIFPKKSGHFKSKCICIRDSQASTVGTTSAETSQAGLDLRTLQTPWKSSEPLSSMSCILLPTVIKALTTVFGLIDTKMCRAGSELTTPRESCRRVSFSNLWPLSHSTSKMCDKWLHLF